MYSACVIDPTLLMYINPVPLTMWFQVSSGFLKPLKTTYAMRES